MKVKKFESRQLLKLYFTKLRVYEVRRSKNLFVSPPSTSVNLTGLLVDIKRALHVIYNYHSASKLILFVGLPKDLEAQINLLTAHVAVPKIFQAQNLHANFNVVSESNNRKSFLKTSRSKLSKKPALIVLFSSNYTQQIFSEVQSLKVPLVVLNCCQSLDELDPYSYIVKSKFADLSLKKSKNLFFTIFRFLF